MPMVSEPRGKPASPRPSIFCATNSTPPWACAASTPSPRSTNGCWRIEAKADETLSLPSPATGEGRSHRRGDAVAADIDAVGFERTVVLLRRAENDDLGAGFQLGLVADHEGHDRRLRRHHHFLLAVLV